MQTRKKTLLLMAMSLSGLTSYTVKSADLIDAGTFGGGQSYAYAISANGAVLVGFSRIPDGTAHAFKYTESGGAVDLGTLGGDRSIATAVSADGEVVVGESQRDPTSPGGGVFHAFKHRDSTGMVDLGTLGTYSTATGISADGEVVVGNSGLAAGIEHAFKHRDSTGMVDLGTLGGDNSSATGVSANGDVIVGNSDTASGNQHAFKHTDSSGMVDLGTLGGDTSTAIAVSANGAIVAGNADLASGDQHAFKHSDSTGMVDLGTLGGTSSSSTALSANGEVVVGKSALANGNEHAFKHSDSTGMVDLGTLGGNSSSAAAVSADGAVVVGSSDIANGNRHAFVFQDGTGMVDLGTLGGANSEATSISADGKVVVGNSDTASGESHAFIGKITLSPKLVDVDNSYTGLLKNRNQLKSVLNLQNTLISDALGYDCTVFGEDNICVAVGGGYSRVDSPTASRSGINLRVAYRVTPQVRIGAFMDQSVNDSLPSNYKVKNSQPMMGAFAAWSAQEDGLGPKVKASFAFSKMDTRITRTALANTESGRGTSSVDAQGVKLEGSYGIAINQSWNINPFLGIKHTKAQRDGYTEKSGADFPITYKDVASSATTMFTGAELLGKLTSNATLITRAGIEQDLSRSTDEYTSHAEYLGGLNMKFADERKTRAFASVGAEYQLTRSGIIGVNLSVAEQPFDRSLGYGINASYSIGF